MEDWIQLLIILVTCLLGVGFFSSIETALGGVPEPRVRLARDKKLRNAQHLGFWLEAPGRVLTTLHLLRLFCVLGAGVTAVALLRGRPLAPSDLVVVGGVAGAVLLFGHLVPRVLAKRFALQWALSTIRVVRGLAWLLYPLVLPLMLITRLVARWARVAPTRTGSLAFWTPDEVGKLAGEARADALGKSNEDLYRSMIEFSDTVIREIMVPRTEMVTLPVDASRDEVLRTVVEARHSRIPVYEETVDNVLGLLYAKDLSATPLPAEPAGVNHLNLGELVRPSFYVPEVMKISELLREFQKRKTHMAIVVDEYGGTAGLVTLEDIIEEIVGEIQDEYDIEEKQFRVLGDNKVLADGRVSIWDLEEPLGVEFPENGGYETLAGFLTARAGYLPPTGTVITWDGLRFTVKEANEKRIATVEIERRPKAESKEAARKSA